MLKQNSEVILFLGSGVSLESGMPSTAAITDALFRGKWHRHTDCNFYPGYASESGEPQNWVTRIQDFLKLLRRDAKKYYKARPRGEVNYEDLFFLSQQIQDELSGNIHNPLVSPYIKRLRIRTKGLCVPLKPIEHEFDLGKLAGVACNFIECVVWHSLRGDHAPVGFDLLPQLARDPKIKQLDICTLNHDLLIETVLEHEHIESVDGFGEADGQLRWFDPRVYETGGKIRIFKLHGSLNWWRMERQESEGASFQFAQIANGVSSMNCKDHTGERILEIDARPRFLTGSYNKISEYRYGIFAELHLRFFQLLRERQTIVMSGYGWNDKGINGWLTEWLMSSRKNRIILLHQNPEKIRDESQSSMWHRFDELVKSGQLILRRKWFSETKRTDLFQ